MSRNGASAAQAKRKGEEEVSERGTGGKPNSSPRDRVVFFENVFPSRVSEELVYRLLEQTSPDGPIQS